MGVVRIVIVATMSPRTSTPGEIVMGETHEKRGRAQRKKMKRTDKVERKKLRREQASANPVSDVVEASHFFPPEDRRP